MSLKLYHIRPNQIKASEFEDAYTEAVVVAKSEEDAKLIYPSGELLWSEKYQRWYPKSMDIEDEISYSSSSHLHYMQSWAHPKDVLCKLLSDCVAPGLTESEIICRNFYCYTG